MIAGLRVLGLIPARGGSKGLPGKNILRVEGRPLLAWSVDAALASHCVDRTVLSSEDEAIIATARECGCDVAYRRPAELATDTATSIEVVLHALDELPGHDLVVLLQPTSPLRTAADIDAACEMLVARQAPACVSVTAVEQSPYWMYRIDARQVLDPIVDSPAEAVRRQELPPVYVLNGAVYVARSEWLRRTRSFVTRDTLGYVMPAARSIDIDTAEDFEAFRRACTRNLHA